MTVFTNDFSLPSGAAIGDAITTTNSAAGGTAFALISLSAGATAVYTATGGAFNLGSGSSYFRLDSIEAGSRMVMRRPLYLQASPDATRTFMQMRSATDGQIGGMVMMTNRALRVAYGPTGTIIVASESDILSLNTQYFVELACTKGTTTSDGRVEFRITDSNDLEVYAYDSNGSGIAVNTGIDDGTRGRFGGFGVMAGWTQDQFDGPLRVAKLSSNWIGPVTPAPGPIPPAVNAGSDVSFVAGSTVALSGTATDADGVIASVSWTVQTYPPALGTAPTIVNASSLTTASFTATASGVYVIRLTATDNSSLSSFDEKTVTVTTSGVSADDLVWTGTSWN